MTISEFHESTIIEVKAYFGFDHFECSPDEITKALSISPDGIKIKGKKRKLKSGHEMDIFFNSWSIESKIDSKDINEHLRELLNILKGKQDCIKPEFGKPDFSVLWKGNYLYAGSGPFYESDVIIGIAEWNAELYQDIYQIDQEEEEVEYKSELKRIPKC
jgi:uncharacterized protein DUF4279